MISPKGEHAVIRKAETVDSLRNHESTPAWL
jgi:hypothetical protein